MSTLDTRNRPNAEYRYWVYDPSDSGSLYFRDLVARDKYAAEVISNHCDDDGWNDDVEFVCVGEVTAVAQKTNVKVKPPADELDEDGCDDEGTYWGEFDEICDYSLQAIPVETSNV